MTDHLKLARGLTLPPEAMLQRFAILAMSGAGKSNTAAVMAEQMFAADIPWVVIDPKGDWWGLRSSKTGKSDGLDVPIFGGQHADIPLYEDGGQVMADAIANELPHAILDVSEFDSKAAMLRFLTAFAERLYKVNRKPLMVILEEADEFIPQKTNSPAEAVSVGVWSRMVKRGRTRGLFTTLISQRIAELAKSVLNQSDTVIALRATAKLDRDAIKGWIEYSGAAAELLASLPELDDGHGWIASPQKLKITKQVKFDRRHTFDSGGTPTLDGSRERVKIASIDLSAIDERMKETIERAKAEDPAELRKQIVGLRKQLADRPEVAPEPERVEVPVEVQVPVLDKRALRDMRGVLEVIDSSLAKLPAHFESLVNGFRDPVEDVRAQLDRAEKLVGTPRPAPSAPKPAPAPAPPPRRSSQGPPAPASDLPADGEVTLKKAERTILNCLAQFPEGRTKKQIAIGTGYRITSGGFRNALGKLRQVGYAVGSDPLQVTEAGIAAAGHVEPIPTGQALLDFWMGNGLKQAERTILATLHRAYPEPMTKEEIAIETEYRITSGGFRNALGLLRSLELIEGSDPIIASQDLFG